MTVDRKEIRKLLPQGARSFSWGIDKVAYILNGKVYTYVFTTGETIKPNY